MNITEKPEKAEIVIDQKQFEKKEKLLFSIKPQNGHKLFEYNYKTGIISLAEYEVMEIDYLSAKRKDFSKRKKVKRKENCVYFTALNFKNAQKVLKRTFKH